MRTHILFIFIFIGLLSWAQTGSKSQLNDSLSYQAYLKKDWNKVIELGKRSLKQGQKFEYLDLRMGIAYYEKKNFRKAIGYFQKALVDEVNSETTAEYLYYAYQYIGNDLEASKVLFQVDSKFSKVKRNQFRFLKNIYAFSSFRQYDQLAYKTNINAVNLAQIEENKKHTYSTQYIPKSYINYHAGLSFRVIPAWSINVALQNFQIEREQYFVDAFKDTSFTSKVKQNQFYIKNSIALSQKLQLSVYASYLANTSNFFTINTEDFPPIYEAESQYFSSNLLMGLGLTRAFNYFDMELSGSYMTTKRNAYFQANLGMNIFPFGNRKLSLKSELSTLKTESVATTLILSETLSYSPFERISLSLTARWGDMRNYSIDQAYNVYNGIYNLDQVLQSNLTIRLFNQVYFKFYYELTCNTADIKSKEMTLEKSESSPKTVDYINFNTHSFIGGLIWEF